MIEGFLLDRVNAITAGASVSIQHDLTLLISPHKTKPLLPFVEFAISRTDIALDTSVPQFVPISRGDHRAFGKKALQGPVF